MDSASSNSVLKDGIGLPLSFPNSIGAERERLGKLKTVGQNLGTNWSNYPSSIDPLSTLSNPGLFSGIYSNLDQDTENLALTSKIQEVRKMWNDEGKNNDDKKEDDTMNVRVQQLLDFHDESFRRVERLRKPPGVQTLSSSCPPTLNEYHAPKV